MIISIFMILCQHESFQSGRVIQKSCKYNHMTPRDSERLEDQNSWSCLDTFWFDISIKTGRKRV